MFIYSIYKYLTVQTKKSFERFDPDLLRRYTKVACVNLGSGSYALEIYGSWVWIGAMDRLWVQSMDRRLIYMLSRGRTCIPYTRLYKIVNWPLTPSHDFIPHDCPHKNM